MYWLLSLYRILSNCNVLTFDRAVNRETGASGRRYHLDLWTGWIWCRCDTHKKQVGVKQSYNPVPQTVWVSWSQFVGVQVAVRCSENQHKTQGLGPQDPGWAAQQNEEEVLLWPEELGVNMLQFVPFPTYLSHTTISHKVWEVYFSKEQCSFFIIVDYVSACICFHV